MKIVMLTGSYPPDHCGVGDYTYQLITALKKAKVNVSVLHHRDWRLSSLPSLISILRQQNSNILHIQYPTIGYGKSIIPQIISLILQSTNIVVTLHEFSQAHILRRLSIIPFTLRSYFIFTNEGERDSLCRWTPWVRRRSDIIPIGSNIPFTASPGEKNPEVIYFGIIKPGKGIEEFLALARMAWERESIWKFRLLGFPHPHYPRFLDRIRALPYVSLHLSLGPQQVAEILSRATFAYLPYPDGASERRGSLLAALGNEVLVITTRGPQMPPEFEKFLLFAHHPAEALQILESFSEPSERFTRLRREARKYLEKISWAAIASRHIELYSGLSLR
jgi:glycosyltransferase involved in cell wall biosynthesis